MSGEKKLWRWPPPFRGCSGKQDPPLKAKLGHSGSRICSVYLSDDSPTNGFIIVPEFDDPVRAESTHEESSFTQHPPAVTCHSKLLQNSVEDTGFQYGSSLGGGCCDTLVGDTGQDDDLAQRLDSAYEHIRSMPPAASPKVLSSDPQMLRKQLGVPQHSVLNYPISPPDLPNPHTTLREPTSPRLPPTTSPYASHARTSKKLGLRTNTNVYPPSRNRFPDPAHWSAQRKSTVNAPTLLESPPLTQGIPWEPWSTNTASTSKPQPFNLNSSKLAKRCIGSPTVSPSLPPSSHRQTLRGGLREPAADTRPSKYAPRWQKSLPQIRPPSPFRVDMPLHHTWHDRRTDFNSPSEYHSKIVRLHETKLRQTNRSTNVLASLAWIGTAPIVSGSYATTRGHHSVDTEFLSDRLSMAITVEDDDVSDDVLVDQLEKVCRIGGHSDSCRDFTPLESSINGRFQSAGEDENGHSRTLGRSPPDQLSKPCDISLPPSLTSGDTISDPDDAAVWQAARKALLCVREIVRTEKRYQQALKMLLNAQTATPPPPSMAPYILALARASETLLKCFLEDPSAWGVSVAFVTSEDDLEAAMVSWCAVAGMFFTGGDDARSGGLAGKWRLRKSEMMTSSSPPVTKQSFTSSSPRLPPMSIIGTANKIKEQTEEESCAGRYPLTEQERKTSPLFLRDPERTGSHTSPGRPPGRKLSVRDLAIQPIQRVMRYVLLYRDLLDCTPPTSPSRLLVERALEAAMRIANHCDRAQRNPAFCHAS